MAWIPTDPEFAARELEDVRQHREAEERRRDERRRRRESAEGEPLPSIEGKPTLAPKSPPHEPAPTIEELNGTLSWLRIMRREEERLRRLGASSAEEPAEQSESERITGALETLAVAAQEKPLRAEWLQVRQEIAQRALALRTAAARVVCLLDDCRLSRMAAAAEQLDTADCLLSSARRSIEELILRAHESAFLARGLVEFLTDSARESELPRGLSRPAVRATRAGEHENSSSCARAKGEEIPEGAPRES